MKRAACYGVLAALLAFLFWPAGGDGSKIFQGGLTDTLHAPFFLLLVVVVYRLLAEKGDRRKAFFRALGISVTVALVSELVQPFVGRTRSGFDLAMNLCGIGLGAAGVYLFARSSSPVWRGAWIVLTLGVVVAASWPALRSRLAHLRVDKQFPLLGDFENALDLAAWQAQGESVHGRTSVERSPDGASSGRYALKIVTTQGDYAGVRIELGTRDWSRFEALAFEVFNPGEAFLLGVRIDDDGDGDGDGDREGGRFAVGLPVEKGRNSLRVALEEFERNPLGGTPQLGAVNRVVFYTGMEEPGRVFYLDHVRLE